MNTVDQSAGMMGARIQLVMRKLGVGIALLILMLLFSLSSEHFLTQGNLTNILTQITINLTLAVGLTFVILIGGIDLSVGSVLALSAVVSGMIISNASLSPGVAILLAMLAAMSVGLLCGLANGALSALWGLPSFIITLGMLNIARGTALEITDAQAIYSFPEAFSYVGSIIMFGVPLLFVVALGLVLVAWFVLSRTVFGRMVYAIGNNEEAVRLAGHGRDHDHDLVAGLLGGERPGRDVPDAVDVGDGGAAVLLHDERHSVPFGMRPGGLTRAGQSRNPCGACQRAAPPPGHLAPAAFAAFAPEAG